MPRLEELSESIVKAARASRMRGLSLEIDDEVGLPLCWSAKQVTPSRPEAPPSSRPTHISKGGLRRSAAGQLLWGEGPR